MFVVGGWVLQWRLGRLHKLFDGSISKKTSTNELVYEGDALGCLGGRWLMKKSRRAEMAASITKKGT